MKRPTQVDLAQLADVSKATSVFLSNRQMSISVNIFPKPLQHSLHAVTELGYRPNAQIPPLCSRSTNTFTVLGRGNHTPPFWQAQYKDNLQKTASKQDAAGFRLSPSDTTAAWLASGRLELRSCQREGTIIKNVSNHFTEPSSKPPKIF